MDSRASCFVTRVWRLALLGLAGAFLCLEAAHAQSVDTSHLIDRLERMERELITLQRQVYRGGAPTAAPMAPGAIGSGQVDTNFAAQTEVRFSQFEGELRALTGKVEEIGHGLDQLRSRLDKLVSDVDFRLRALEQGGGSAAAQGSAQAQAQAQSQTPPQGQAQRPALSPARPGGGAGQNPNQPASAEGVLGTLRPGQVPTDPPPTPPPAQQQASLPPGSPDEQYKYAFDILARQRDYEGAERAFRAFLKAHPTHALAGNAQYWLGETHYARKEFEKAAVEFAEGYKKFPKDAKAPDSVLKLGMALAALNQGSEACKALQGFDQRFPGDGQTLQNLRDRAARERQRLNCR